ncbi:hypothetical protein GLOIN_2v1778254 [Rhizophagus clarus]|uniref:BTB domain-containing protein n=1 Tax=Rhizophagus clarus TaxID=94130 RepID=A0A8H3L8D4_9GLOM|nr:hypothetical protein GLOIN_2v1778254 [Rhizophagus clarus]
MTSIFYSGLSKDFSLILNDADDFNAIIQVGEKANIKEFRVHSVILRARSPYFKSAFSTDWVTQKDGMILYNKPNITPRVFDIVLKYIYAAELDLNNYQGEDILKLLVASDELLLEELFDHVQDYLIEKQTTWVKENFFLVLQTAFKITRSKKLQGCCIKFICMNPQPFITSENFLRLDKDILYVLLNREDLQIDEIIIWESLIKWGINYLGYMNNDRTKWNNRNYEALKKTLEQFIPLIRFGEISLVEYFDKVQPYKAIIPDHIYEEIEEFFKYTTILPPRIGKIQFESKILKKKFVPIIINWINKRNTSAIPYDDDSSYKFDLIYQVLIKCKGTRKVFGGYAPLGFYRNEFKGNPLYKKSTHLSSTDSFIFSLVKKDDTLDIRLSNVVSCDHAVFNNYFDFHGSYGFNFGERNLCMENNRLYVLMTSYYECNLNYNSLYTTETIKEIEAFRVIKQ